MVDDVLFSEWLNEQIRRKHWTQAQLARFSGLAPATINKLLNSKTKQPSPGSGKAIATALGIAQETVYRAAKLSSTVSEFPEQDDLKMVIAQLPSLERQKLLAIAKVLFKFKKKGYNCVN